MKAVALAVIVWLLCGMIGDLLLDARGQFHWKHVAGGPLTMFQVFVD